MTHLHIPVPAITRGTLASTHELKNEEGERKEEEDFFPLSPNPEPPRMFFLLTLCAPPAISKVKPIKLFLQDTINVKSFRISTKSCVLFWHPVKTVDLLSARLLIMIT